MRDIYFYGDKHTLSALNQKTPKVLLLGGYLGYNNFGDILQLKGAIKYHKEVTKLEPIVICSLDAIPNKEFINKVKEWFNIELLLFATEEVYNTANLELKMIEESWNIEHLHVYGGGFFNGMWGSYITRTAEALIQSFLVKSYVLSGQQISEEFLPTLKEHFKNYPPKAIGVRDKKSLELLYRAGIEGQFSFDDAFDILSDWVQRRPEKIEDKHNIILHINTSSYSFAKDKEAITNRIEKNLSEIHYAYPEHKLLLLQAYEDKRFAVKDTLSSIIDMEDQIPFTNYHVVDLAKMALLHDPGDAKVDESLLEVNGTCAISSSYHTTMFLHLLNIPCWLVSLNEYYNQKREGLSIENSLEEFLRNPLIPSYKEKHELRQKWLNTFYSHFIPENHYEKLLFNYGQVDYKQEFVLKNDGISEFINNLESGRVWLENKVVVLEDDIKKRDEMIEELKEWNSRLEEGKTWLEDKYKVMQKELDDKDRIVTELKDWIDNLEKAKDWLESKLRNE